MSNPEQSFLSKDVPPAFMRVIQPLLLAFILMVMGQLTRVDWQNRLDLGIVLSFLLVVLAVIFASTLIGTSSRQQ